MGNFFSLITYSSLSAFREKYRDSVDRFRHNDIIVLMGVALLCRDVDTFEVCFWSGGMMIPDFLPNGNLPPGCHHCAWDELESRFGTNEHRKRLIAGMKRALEALKRAGCQWVYMDGSFVTTKERPNDYDACWDVRGVEAQRLDPVFLIFDNGRLAQKIKYLGEFFPAQLTEQGSGSRFLDFFQIDKSTGEPKGIVVIDLQGMP